MEEDASLIELFVCWAGVANEVDALVEAEEQDEREVDLRVIEKSRG